MPAAWPAPGSGAAVDDVPRVTFSKGPWKVSLFGENLANDHGAVSIRTIGLALGFAFD